MLLNVPNLVLDIRNLVCLRERIIYKVTVLIFRPQLIDYFLILVGIITTQSGCH